MPERSSARLICECLPLKSAEKASSVGFATCISEKSGLAVQLQELASSLQLVFLNDQAISPESRRAVFRVSTAYSDTIELPNTDCSVARVVPYPDFSSPAAPCDRARCISMPPGNSMASIASLEGSPQVGMNNLVPNSVTLVSSHMQPLTNYSRTQEHPCRCQILI